MKVKVVSITGAGRSGSTILDNILGGVNEAFSVGELRYLWQRGLIEERKCGCSDPLPECAVWPEILDRAFPDGIDAHTVAKQMKFIRTRYTPAASLRSLRGWYRKRLSPLVDVLDALYPAIAAETGARFIVDSSKLPTYTYLLGQVPSVDLRIVHLVRDPRAVAHSRARRKEQLDTAERRAMTQSRPARSATDWLVWNTTIRRLFGSGNNPYMMLRYEDLISSPTESIERVLEIADEQGADLSHIRGNEVTLSGNHTVSGNPGRFQTGTITLALDEAWRRDMDESDRRTVERITTRARKSFGYD
ncbi:MAG: sulfotransferase [Acidimicrobiia bacterium]|nr:sulfotransferase [Acidimicrobiia bacterium]